MSLNVNEIISLRLRTLRDIEGVLGSFLVGERGELLGRDVTAACGSDVLALVSGRLQQLCDAFKSAAIGGAFESTTLYFPHYKLHVRALSNVFVVAVVSAEVNLPALKMAVNMLSRQLLADLADPRWTVEAAQVAAAAARQLQQSRESVEPPARVAYPPPTARTSQVPAMPRSTVRASVAPVAPALARTSNVPPPSAARTSSVPPPPPAARTSTVSPPSAAQPSAQPELAATATRMSSPPPPPAPARDSRTTVSPPAPRTTQIGYASASPSRDSLRQSRSPEQQPGRESSVPPRSFRGTRVAH